jgi:serine/threonine protein kinase
MFEYELLKSVDHPQFPQAVEFIKHEMVDEFYLMMELVEYPSLKQLQQSAVKMRIAEDKMQTIAFKILRGINALHKAGICHRDLSPNNILVLIQKDIIRVKIIDFGVAQKFLTPKPEQRHQ